VPDYYVIDQAGQLRAADVTNGAVEDVIKFLLAEKEPKKAAKPDKKESPAKPAPESK
jgi:hypothetical protein